jgi:hypothetical protein
MKQFRARVTNLVPTGGGQHGQASLYELTLENGDILTADYIEIALDSFRQLRVGDEVWCTRSSDNPDWAVYVIPIREISPLQLLGIDDEEDYDGDPFAALWL